jgi:hypothetical protein
MEHVNPVILIAIVIQALISRASHIAGSIAGYLITTGILLWGLDAYSSGDAIAFFGITMEKSGFLFFCVFWYGYDTYHLFSGFGAQAQDADEEETIDPETLPEA